MVAVKWKLALAFVFPGLFRTGRLCPLRPGSLLSPLLAAFAATGLVGTSVARAQLTLVQDRQPQSVIMTAPNPNAIVLLAAQELQKHLQLMSGALVPIDTVGKESNYSGKAFIYVGPSTATSTAGISTSSLTLEFYIIKTVGSNLYIVGRDSTNNTDYTDLSGCQPGTMFGVYHLLTEVLGVHWLWPGDLGIVAPQTATITVPTLNITTGPNMDQRKFRNPRDGFYTSGAAAYAGNSLTITAIPTSAAERLSLGQQELLWQRRMRMGTRNKPPFGHSETTWWDTYKTTHPEYFAVLLSGSQPKPDATEVKLNLAHTDSNGNLDVVQARVDSWVAAGKPNAFNICPNDSRNFCVCPECLAWDRPSQPASIVNSDSSAKLGDRYARWYKEIADRIKAIKPTAVVYGYAYDTYKNAPYEVMLPDNVALAYIPGAPSQVVRSQIEETETNVLGWIAHGCTKMYLRPNWMLAAHTGPFFPTHRLGNHFRDMLAGGYLLGLDSDSSQGCYAPMGLYYYMVARLMNKPDITVEEILDEYCSGFGSAAKRVRDYFTYWENFIYNQADSGNTAILGWSSGMSAYGATYTDAAFDGAEEILNEAAARLAPTETAARDRLDFLRIGCIHGRLTAQALRLTDTAKKTVALRALLAYRDATAGSFALWREWLIDRECYGAGLTSLWSSVLANPSVGYGSNAGTFTDSAGQVVIEAEHATSLAAGTGTYASVNWQENTGTTGAVGTTMQALLNGGLAAVENTAAPRLDFKIDFRATGTWYVWVRMPALASSDDSVNIGLDGAIASKNIQNTTGNWAWLASNAGGARVTVNVTSAGVHTLNLWMREDGAIVDRLVLSTNPSYVLAASDSGPAESTRRSTTESLLVVGSGTGDGYFGSSSIVSISADSAPANYVFDRWVGDTAAVANVFSASTTMTMPAADARIDATYKLSPSVDTDADGILDSWEIANFANLTTATATSDTDGDGASDLSESLAGTDPKNASAFLHITSITKDENGDVVVQWPSMAGKTYRLLTRTDLSSGSWAPLAINIPGVSPLTTYTVHPSTNRLFMRVEVE